MKNLIILSFLVMSLAACEVTVVEPVAPVYDGRNRVVGKYAMSEYSETYNDVTNYTIDIAKSSYSSREIIIYNFYLIDDSIIAYLDGDKIIIPQQTVSGYKISGVGTFWGGSITLNYTVIDLYSDAPTDYCSGTAE